MKHFLNDEFGAANVLKVAVDADIVAEFAPMVRDAPDADFFTARPKWASDLRWVSPATVQAFATFQSAFDRLGIADHVAPFLDLDRRVRLYSGFLVIRSHCTEPSFHLDWVRTNNEAFTLITPLAADSAGFGLLYKRLDGSVADYDYRPGEAIIFGDHFVHSTKPGAAREPVALLSFTFGTDKMVHWDKILRTAGFQSRLVCQPDGNFTTYDHR